jgi:M6 family metalloprotease-like protein
MHRNIRLVVTAVILIAAFASAGLCMEPPGPGEIAEYRSDGTLPERGAFMRMLQNHRFHPALVNRKLAALNAGTSGPLLQTQSLPYAAGLPSRGTPEIFILLIDFPGLPHNNEPAVFTNKIFGSGEAAEYPYESLREFYQRSSYGALDIQGEVFGWYTARVPRFFYGTGRQSLWGLWGVKALIKEALRYYEPLVDFSQFDHDADGVIDYFCVIWTGPDSGWGSLWWGWCDTTKFFFGNDPFTVDGKRLGVFSWQPEQQVRTENTVFTARTLIHETGHALGLPDYYDYDTTKGPGGGLGGLDIMDMTAFDHNAFSKWMLDWTEPAVIINGAQTITLRPADTYHDCVAIMPGRKRFSLFSEFFLVQHRSPGRGNDFSLPGSGLVIWHVDGRLNSEGTDFAWDNSYASHKLLRLMEADSMEEIETGDGKADAEDFYTPALLSEFSPQSAPGSTDYAGDATGVSVTGITGEYSSGLGWDSITADFSIEAAE